jgi:hypothetical protein
LLLKETATSPGSNFNQQGGSIFNQRRQHKGNISKTQADQKALAEYAEFNRTQKIESDFDRVVKAMKALGRADVKPGSKRRWKAE